MLITFVDHIWSVLEIVSVAVGIASGVVLILPLFSSRMKRGKRQSSQSEQGTGRRNAAIALAVSAAIFVVGVVREQYFIMMPEFNVSASYQIISVPWTDENVTIRAQTSKEADYVTITAESGTTPSEVYNMRTYDKQNWTFPANFYIKGTYKVTVCAYDSEGNTSSDVLTITYPFS